MGECPQGAAVNSRNYKGGVSYPCKADDVGSSSQEDRSRSKGEVGEGEGGKEGCIE
jgi:hypothetical protein